MPQQLVGQMTQAELARFIQAAVRTQLAQLPVSLTLQTATITELLNASKKVNVTGVVVLMPNLPTSDPHVIGQLYTSAGAVMVSAG